MKKCCCQPCLNFSENAADFAIAKQLLVVVMALARPVAHDADNGDSLLLRRLSFAEPIRVERAFSIESLVGVRTEVITLSLQQVRR